MIHTRARNDASTDGWHAFIFRYRHLGTRWQDIGHRVIPVDNVEGSVAVGAIQLARFFREVGQPSALPVYSTKMAERW